MKQLSGEGANWANGAASAASPAKTAPKTPRKRKAKAVDGTDDEASVKKSRVTEKAGAGKVKKEDQEAKFAGEIKAEGHSDDGGDFLKQEPI